MPVPQAPVRHTELQKRVVRVLITGQILGGIGMGATLSLGALLAAALSGSSAWSGMAATMSTLGAAIVAVPLARLAQANGRRVSLAAGSFVAGTGAVLAITSVSADNFALLLLALMLLGVGSATNLQARFAATDLASSRFRARDLSIVVWSTTIGAVLGPNLFGPGEVLGAALGLPAMTGAFAFSLAATITAAFVYALGLRPDPLLTALAARTASAGIRRASGGLVILRSNAAARYAVAVIALSHATMVALMSMAPVHLRDHGASLTIIGLTISLHVAGMYAVSPVFGALSDRLGRLPVVLGGQVLLLVALTVAWFSDGSQATMTVSLVFLGLGWSASVVAGSALVSEAVEIEDQSSLQGFSDLSMNAAGALGGALAGPILALAGYSGLGLAAMALVAVVVVWSVGRGRVTHAR
ncbi:MFS transporter [Cryobacterium gelidum]|uniref:MFS transporter n=2 Tax=Cryobacterium gelidum TaxID=1259164 RepID=A0A4R9B1J3_9MICO|nr:MFS transporter [Cryobacterium gelidum]